MKTEKPAPSYLQKFKDAPVRSGIPYPKWYKPLISGLGGSITIAALHLLSVEFGIVACFIVPFGASCALVFGIPAAPVSQPRNVVAGHILSALIGIVTFLIFGQATWWTLAIAIGAAMAAMEATKTFHPPAAVTVLLPLLNGISGFTWALLPVGLGAVIVVVIGVLYNNIFAERQYPVFWW